MDIQLAGVLGLLVLFSLGILNCYFGYRLFIITVGVLGFVLAASFGYFVGDWLENNLITLILVLVLGLIGAWASIMAYYAFIFLVGGFGCVFFIAFIMGFYKENIPIPILFIGGLIGGLLALWMQRIIIVIATAAQGALSSVLAVGALFSGGGTNAYLRSLYRLFDGDLSRKGGIWLYVGILAWLLLFVSGMTTQFLRGKEMYRRGPLQEKAQVTEAEE